MDRREMIKTTTSGVLLAAISSAALAKEEAHSHAGMPGMGKGMATSTALVTATAAAVIKGQACLQHCVAMMGDGEKELGRCAALSTDMIAACTAIQQLSSNKSPHLGSMAKVTMAICNDCEKECRKFEKTHEVCKEAADACATCRMELTKVAA